MLLLEDLPQGFSYKEAYARVQPLEDVNDASWAARKVDDTTYFFKVHRDEIGRWHRPGPKTHGEEIAALEALAFGSLAPSYRHFLETYGSLSLVLPKELSDVDDLRSFLMPGGVGTGHSALYLPAPALVIRESRTMQGFGVSKMKHIVTFHGGWTEYSAGFAFDYRHRLADGEAPIYRFSEECAGELLPKDPKAFNKHTMASGFGAWLRDEVDRIIKVCARRRAHGA